MFRLKCSQTASLSDRQLKTLHYVKLTKRCQSILTMNGAATFRSSVFMLSKYSSNEGPFLYHGATFSGTRSLIPCVVWAAIGIKNRSVLGLYPTPFKNDVIFFTMSLYLSSDHSTVGSSCLFTTTTSLLTPWVFARTACSRV
jgi:hypothetical protein